MNKKHILAQKRLSKEELVHLYNIGTYKKENTIFDQTILFDKSLNVGV